MRRVAFAAAAILFATGCAADGQVTSHAKSQPAQEQPMSIVYQRSGGFAGFLDELRIEGDTLVVTRRKKELARRPLSAEEQQELAQLAKGAESAPAPGHLGAPGADTFTISVTLGATRAPQLLFQGHAQVPSGLSPQWEALVKKLQALFSDAIAHH